MHARFLPAHQVEHVATQADAEWPEVQDRLAARVRDAGIYAGATVMLVRTPRQANEPVLPRYVRRRQKRRGMAPSSATLTIAADDGSGICA